MENSQILLLSIVKYSSGFQFHKIVDLNLFFHETSD
jgi:hypothetical protein